MYGCFGAADGRPRSARRDARDARHARCRTKCAVPDHRPPAAAARIAWASLAFRCDAHRIRKGTRAHSFPICRASAAGAGPAESQAKPSFGIAGRQLGLSTIEISIIKTLPRDSEAGYVTVSIRLIDTRQPFRVVPSRAFAEPDACAGGERAGNTDGHDVPQLSDNRGFRAFTRRASPAHHGRRASGRAARARGTRLLPL